MYEYTPTNDNEFLKDVSVKVLGKEDYYLDFEGTLQYELSLFPERSREIFYMILKDKMSLRDIGAQLGISGERVRVVFDKIIERLSNDRMMKVGITAYIDEVEKRAKEYGEMNSRSIHYKLGYTDGFTDGEENKKPKYFASNEYDNISIEDMELSYRSWHYLFNEGITTVSNIISYGNDLLSIRHLGKNCYQEILTKLHEFGVDVKERFPLIIQKYGFTFDE